MVEEIKRTAFKWLEENRDRITEISDKIWEYAELGLIEFKSSKLLADELERHGFKVERGVAGMPTAFVASWGEGKPVIGIMGEYDALPGLSQKKVPWKEPLEPGKPGHGCGHNLFGAASVGAAIALKQFMEAEDLKGTIKLFGTPAEETVVGKVYMAKAGVFDGLDAVLEWHPGGTNEVRNQPGRAMNSFCLLYTSPSPRDLSTSRMPSSA